MKTRAGHAARIGMTTFALACLTVAAQSAEIPASIRAEYENADSEGCKLAPQAVQSLDLQGDGTPYYLVDNAKLACPGSNPYCGSGGCGLDVFTGKAGGFVRILQDIVQSYRVSKAGAGYELQARHKSEKPSRYRFKGGCAVEIGSAEPPSCGEIGK